MPHPWRRLHAPDIIAQVQQIPGFGTWEATVWRSSAPETIVRAGVWFQLLTVAQKAADTLAAETYGHACDEGQCGRWLPRAK